MKQNFDNLGYRGTVKDYSSFNKGDTVIIPKTHSILRRSLSALYENERRAMSQRATQIGATLETVETRVSWEITFK